MNYRKLSTFALFLGSTSLIQQSANADVTIRTTSGLKTHTVEMEGIDQSSDNGFTSLSLKGMEKYDGIIKADGKPEIPVVRFMVFGKPVIKASEGQTLRNFSQEKLRPVAASQVKTKNSHADLVIDNATYESSKPYPASLYSVEEAGSIHGQKRYLVTLHPVQYVGASNSIIYTKNFQVTSKAKKERNKLGVKILFLVGEQFSTSAALEAYRSHKETLGYVTESHTVSRGASADDVRAVVKRVYKDSPEALEHVLIIGDLDDVPAHSARHISGKTDHYYRAIDTDNYESDLSAPDVGVGRLSARDEDQLAAITRKYMRYENGDFGRQAWLSRASFLATNDRWEVAEATHNYAIDNYTTNDGIYGNFPERNQEGGDKLYAITHRAGNSEVMQASLDGRKIINYSGHGATTFWDNPRMTQGDVRSLTNLDYLPFVISNACITGKFSHVESFAETWQRHEAGAIMFWGSFDNTYWDEDDILEKAMYDGIYREGNRTFSQITQYALNQHYIHYGGQGKAKYYWETYVTFGDSSISFRAGDSL